jgi:triphosphatase
MRHDLRHIRVPPSDTAAVSDKVETSRREPFVLEPAMTVIEAFAAVTHVCITHIASAADVARKSADAEGIHQVRVGIRRLRAAFSVFGPALPPRRPPVVAQLRSLQQKLGAARELDVLLEETIASMPDKRRNRRGMRELVEVVEADRVASHRRARTALASKRCAELLSRLEPAVARYAKRRANDMSARTDAPITDFAAEVLHSRRRKARKLGKQIDDLDPQELHKLRIRIKKLRYAAEFFGDLASGARNKRYVRALKHLQQLLGTTHDAVVAADLIARIGKRGGAEAERAAALVQKWANKSFKCVTRKLPGAWRRFDKRKSPLNNGKKLRRRAERPSHHGWIPRLVTTGSGGT